jgi:hypothetical protein
MPKISAIDLSFIAVKTVRHVHPRTVMADKNKIDIFGNQTTVG